MTDLGRKQGVEEMLTAWMDGAAPSQAPTRLLEDTFVQTMKTDQLRAFPWHRPLLGAGRAFGGGSRARIALVLVGALLVVIVAGLGGGGPRQPSPSAGPSGSSPVPSPTPTLIPTQRPRPTGVPAQTTAPLPPSTSITAEATVPEPDLLGFETDGTLLWALVPGRIDRIDPSTNTVTGSVPVGKTTDLFNGLAVNADGLWATEWYSATLYRVDPATLTVVASIPAGLAPKGILANADGVWVADTHGGAVLRIDPATNTVIASAEVGPLGNSGPNWLASGLGSIWVDIPNDFSIVRIDPVTNTVQARIDVPEGFTACGGLAIGTDVAWVGGCDASAALGRIDPRTNAPLTVVPLPGHGGPTYIGGALWVSVDTGDASTGMLVRIDPATNTVNRVLVPDRPFGGGGGIVVVGGSVWVSDGYNGVALRFPLAAFAG